MSATYYIKAYFTKKDQQQPEIRRFAVSYFYIEYFVFFLKLILLFFSSSSDRYFTRK